MMRNLFTLFLLLSFTFSFGQIKFYAGGNVTLMPTMTESTPSTTAGGVTGFTTVTPGYTLTESFQRRAGYEFGATYTKSVATKFSVGAGLVLSSVAFKRESEIEYDQPDVGSSGDFFVIGGSSSGGYQIIPTENSGIIGQTENVGETSLKYLTVPLTVSYQVLSKFSIGVGVKNAFLVQSKEVINQVTFNNTFAPSSSDVDGFIYYQNGASNYEITEVNDTSRSGFSSYNLIGVFTLAFNVTNRFGILGAFNQGLSSLYEEEKQIAGDSKLRSVSLGLTYSL